MATTTIHRLIARSPEGPLQSYVFDDGRWYAVRINGGSDTYRVPVTYDPLSLPDRCWSTSLPCSDATARLARANVELDRRP